MAYSKNREGSASVELAEGTKWQACKVDVTNQSTNTVQTKMIYVHQYYCMFPVQLKEIKAVISRYRVAWMTNMILLYELCK